MLKQGEMEQGAESEREKVERLKRNGKERGTDGEQMLLHNISSSCYFLALAFKQTFSIPL